MSLALSILDTSPIVSGSNAAAALRHSVELGENAERWGYQRHWIAEHHGMRGVASAVPSITIGAIAERTIRLRVGAGGVILPNHPPLHVAEQYGMLNALHPARVDLALGRALGGTSATVEALRPREARESQTFCDQLDELESYFLPAPAGKARAVPAEGSRPPIWLLGSSTYSAEVAGKRGLPYAFAHHLHPENTMAALRVYRERFIPSEHLDRPRVLISASVIAGNDDDHGEWLAGSTRLKVLSRHRGHPIQLPSPEDAAMFDYSNADREFIAEVSQSVYSGGISTLRTRLTQLCSAAGADELMITSPIYHHADRLHSYEVLAELKDHDSGVA